MLPEDQELRDHFSYDPETGLITWAKWRRNIQVGDPAGTPDSKGYLKVTLGRKYYRGHRLAWFLHHGVWPLDDIDHINRDRLDNRLVNLREATRSQNRANSRAVKTTGLKGAYWNSRANKWQCVFRHRTLGYFTTQEEAHARYMEAARTDFGEFARAA